MMMSHPFSGTLRLSPPAMLMCAAMLLACEPGNGDGSTGAQVPVASSAVPVQRATVVAAYPHDVQAWTQGLAFHDGKLYESTGLERQSTLREVTLETGQVVRRVDLDDQYFGEGMAILGDRIFQLTWKHEIGFIHDLGSFRRIGEFRYAGEGWGLTTDGTHLVMSDGSDSLRFIDPATFEVIRTVKVRDGTRAVNQLNELEWVNGEVLSNVWMTDRIARINPETGQVTSWIDLTGLLSASDRRRYHVDVLNGIAYDAANDRLFVTGKFWPWVYHIRVE
jgi:glutaminyl-peptide cyclotransferase